MKVFKFGGASVKDADSVKNVAAILTKFQKEKLLVVVSAMGKTTNALEKVVNDFFYQKGNAHQALDEVRNFHITIMEALFENKQHAVFGEVQQIFDSTAQILNTKPEGSFGFYYDSIVSAGELVSTKIVSAHLNESGINNSWLDVRTVLKTDSTYREGKVDWMQSSALAHDIVMPLLKGENSIVLTQGFIGCDSENHTTTLGREGSDYSAAIFAYLLDAEEMYIWKDVPGVLNADPKFYSDAQ